MAVFSGLYHPTDMSMLQDMLKQQQQQRQFGQKQELAQQQFGQQLQQRQAEQKALQDYRLLQQKLAEEKFGRDAELKQAQIETEQMKQKNLDREQQGINPVLERQIKLAQFKEDNKFKHEITSSSKFINKAANSINRMFDALEKNKSLTSPIYGVPVVGNIAKKTFGSKDLGAFAADAANLQTQYANLDLARPGIKAVEFYKQTKPDEGAGEKYNYGMILANAQKIQDTWEIDKSNWEQKFPNTKFPIPDPNMKRIINKINGIENFDSDVPDQAQMQQQTTATMDRKPVEQQQEDLSAMSTEELMKIARGG